MRDIGAMLPDPDDTRPLEIHARHRRGAYLWEPPASRGNTPGYIYLFRYRGFYKIGYATNLHARIAQLNGAYPDDDGELVYSFHTKNMRATEAKLHRRYAAYRKRKEWFVLDQKAIDEIVDYGGRP